MGTCNLCGEQRGAQDQGQRYVLRGTFWEKKGERDLAYSPYLDRMNIVAKAIATWPAIDPKSLYIYDRDTCQRLSVP